jgi:hypothetical protein
MCAGNQCCGRTAASGWKTFPCPSASDSFKGCETNKKVTNCLKRKPEYPYPTPYPSPTPYPGKGRKPRPYPSPTPYPTPYPRPTPYPTPYPSPTPYPYHSSALLQGQGYP